MKRPAARIVLAFGALGIGHAVTTSHPTPDFQGVVRAVTEASALPVVSDSLRWGPAGSVLGDLVVGRWIYFLGETTDETGTRAHDLFRARVRLTPEGTPLSIGAPYNLTRTPVGDDHALVVEGDGIAFATRAFGQEQAITLLRDGEAKNDLPPLERVKTAITNFQETGSFAGLSRLDFAMDAPADDVALTLDQETFRVQVARGTMLSKGAFDRETGEPLNAEHTANMRAQRAPHVEKLFVHWCVDTVRNLSFVGPAPIAWLEERAFAIKDLARRYRFELGAGAEAREFATNDDATTAAFVKTTADQEGPLGWPPPPIPSPWKTKDPGEGEWTIPKIPWIKKSPPDGPPLFVETFVRPDAERPYVKVLLVAMDMQRLELDMEAGVEDPKPLVGTGGTGRIPRDPKVLKRVAATFNGGFKTEHGFYGMMVKKRVLLPPQPGAASIIVTTDGRIGMGSWSNETRGGLNLRGIDDAEVLSYRQNLDPLIDGTTINPTKRAQWGFTLPGTGMQTERSGLCRTEQGSLVYVWGDDVNALTLAKAMKMASCTYGMHLDMNPHHTGFVFTDVDELRGRKYRTELLSHDMEIQPERFLETTLKDFFYVLVREDGPALVDGVPLRPDLGKQPAPTTIPAIHYADLSIEGEPVRITTVDRTSFKLRAGTREAHLATPVSVAEFTGDEEKRLLLAASLGTGDKSARALTIDRVHLSGKAKAGDFAVLSISATGAPTIAKDARDGAVDAAELPSILEGGAVVPSARTRTRATARSAFGITRLGKVVFARGDVSAPSVLAEALVRAGASDAVLLDRGVGASATFARTGTANPPRTRSDETVLVGFAEPMAPRTFRFETTDREKGSKNDPKR